MYVYIDATFDMRPGMSSPETGGTFPTVDDASVRDIPPYLLYPTAIMTATSDGDVDITTDTDPHKVLHGLYLTLNKYATKGLHTTMVGWYMDQVTIPCICANAMVTGTKLPVDWFRKMDDKWSKTAGCSMERAFLQGWYPESREPFTDGRGHLTLDEALFKCGLPSLKEREESEDSSLPAVNRKLIARVSAINALHLRYSQVAS